MSPATSAVIKGKPQIDLETLAAIGSGSVATAGSAATDAQLEANWRKKWSPQQPIHTPVPGDPPAARPGG